MLLHPHFLLLLASSRSSSIFSGKVRLEMPTEVENKTTREYSVLPSLGNNSSSHEHQFRANYQRKSSARGGPSHHPANWADDDVIEPPPPFF